jgi:hypothetical protein
VKIAKTEKDAADRLAKNLNCQNYTFTINYGACHGAGFSEGYTKQIKIQLKSNESNTKKKQ